MPDEITKTETTFREYDDHGNLVQEVTTVITTRKPEPGTEKKPFGFRMREEKR